jgi:alkylation response protein AidB-like acyl-CoA dehydrogenase
MALATFDSSLAWVVTQGAGEMGWLTVGGDPSWVAGVLADPLAASASTVAGLGSVVAGLDAADVDSGEAVLTGRWGFDTGCQGATWIGGLALVVDSKRPSDELDLRICWVPADRAAVIDDWHTLGLRGTGSHSIAIEAQPVSMAWMVSPGKPTTHQYGPHRVVVGNGNWPIHFSVAAVQLGTARRALDLVRQMLVAKSCNTSTMRHIERGWVQQRLTALEGLWMAAMAWAEACASGELTHAQRVRNATAASTANTLAVQVVDGVCELAGASISSAASPIGRCLRDVQTLRGHISTCSEVIERCTAQAHGLAEFESLV